MRRVSRALTCVVVSGLLAAGGVVTGTAAYASSPVDPGTGIVPAHQPAPGAAFPQPPTGTVTGRAAPTGPTARIGLPGLATEGVQPLSYANVPLPTPVDGFDPATSVELPGERTVDTTVFQNANTTKTVFAYNGPVHYKDALGLWQDVDQTLVQDRVDGTYKPKAVGVGLTLAANAANASLATLAVDGAHSVGYRLDSAASSAAWVGGAKAQYFDVRPATDLELVALANGVKETLVLKTPSAPTTFTFPLSLNGVTASVDADGNVVYTDSAGVEWGRTPHGSMHDSLLDATTTGEGAYSEGVTYSLVPFGAGVALRMTLDTTWLNDPARVYPIRVDPTTVTKLTDSDDTFVQSGYSADNSTENELKIGTPDSTPHTTYSYLHFAGINSTYTNYFVTGAELDMYLVHSWTCTAKSWTVHKVTSAWAGSTVKAGAQPTFGGALDTVNLAGKGDTCGGNAWVTPAPDVASAVQDWTHGSANYGLTVRPGSATDVNYWKRFASYQGDPTNHSSAPRLKFSYSSEGAKYAPVSWQATPTNTANGKLRVTLTNWGHDAWPAGGAYKLGYHLYDPDTGALILQDGDRTPMPTTVNPRQSITIDAQIGNAAPRSYVVVLDMVHEGVAYFSKLGVPTSNGVSLTVTNQAPAISKVNSPADLAAVTTNQPAFSVTGADTDNYPAGGALQYYFRICENPDAETPTATCVNSGWISASTWTAPANKLYWRKTYYWHAYIRDANNTQRNPNWVYRFTPVVSDTSAGAHFGADPYGIDSGGVNVSTSSFTTSAVEAAVATIGPPLSVTRTYNSGDTKVGAFGTGWSSLYDMSASADASGNVTVVHADGRKALYGKNPDGTYAASYGYYSTLAAVTGGGWTLTDKGANTYTFSTAGKLTNVKDAAGKQLTLAYDGAGHTTVTDVTSGRALVLTWTGAHVTSAATPSVAATGGPLVWRYYYTGDTLTAACDPRNNALGGSCVTYEYGGVGARLSKITMPRGNAPVQLTYYNDGTVFTRTDGAGKKWSYLAVDTSTSTTTNAFEHAVTVQDPKNHNTQYVYDGLTGRLIRRVDANNQTRTYGYDKTTGFLNKITDENGHTVTLTVDARGNVLSRSVPYGDVAGLVATSFYTYKTATSPTDPTDNKLLTYRDARSASATDNTYAVSYGYSATTGQATSVTTPPTATFPSGTSATWSYTTGSEAAVGSAGTQPAGLLAVETDPRGYTTTYSYNSSGDLTRTVDRAGLRTDRTYDELGRLATETTYPAAYPSGVTTAFVYDLSGNVSRAEGPPILNRRTNITHRQRITYTPDPNGVIRDVTVSDLTGGDPTRVTHYDVDDDDRPSLVRDPEGATTSRTYDDAGNVATITDPRGLVTQLDYDNADRLVTVTAKNFVDDPVSPGVPRDVVVARYTYDNAGWLDTSTDARGVVRDYAWYPDQRVQSVTVKGFHNVDGTTRDVVTDWHRYDAAGNEIVTKTGGYLRTVNSTYNEAGWLVGEVEDPATINRATTYVRDQAGNPTVVQRRQISDGGPTEETRYGYGPTGLVTSVTAENGTTDLLTTIDRDDRGNVTGIRDPRGNAVTPANDVFRDAWTYDEAGRVIQHDARQTTDDSASGQVSVRGATTYGYDTFGDRTQEWSGALRLTSAYDKAGRVTGRAWPSYTPPGGSAIAPTETYGYNPAGDLTSFLDRRGSTATFDYDLRGRLVRRTQPKPDAVQANPVTRWTYDDAGNTTAVVDPTGARTEYTFDDLDQQRTQVDVVRNATPTPARYTTTTTYDDLGNPNKRVKPRGETSYADYDAASEQIQQQDDAGNLWKIARDVAGRVTKRTDPLGRYQTTVYDLAGRATSLAAYSPANVLLHTENATYDAAGNLATYTPSASGPGLTTAATRTYTWDAESRLLSLVEPTTSTHSTTTTFGYAAWGDRTRVTDGNNHTTWTTYNVWHLPETLVEPATTAFPAASDRTWTTRYDAGGLATRVDKPGGFTVARTFDALGRLTAESGTGGPGHQGDASRALGYDLAGRLTTAGHPNGTETFGYDDRGLLTSAGGPAGSVTNGYDEDGRLTSRADAVGTTSVTYDPRDLPATITDPLTGQTQTLTYWNDGQLKSRKYGTSGATRSYTYDNQGRLATDIMNAPSSGTVTASTTYGYDNDGNVSSQVIGPAGLSGAGTHTYGYDLADRLTSWTGPAGATAYAYDDAGNRTTAGSKTYTYDERNRLVSDSAGGTYAYTARGTLANAPIGGTQYAVSADAFDRVTSDSGTAFTYDSLDRVAAQGAAAFSYDGTDPEPVVVGAAKSARGPSGELLATNIGTGGSAIVSNRHGDTTAYVNPATGAVNGSHSYDPFGVKSTLGSSGFGSFQGQQGSPAQRVYMRSRWYDPATATFAGRDTMAVSAPRAAGANRYAYGGGNPVTLADLSGHCWGVCIDFGSAWDTITGGLADVEAAGDAIIAGAETGIAWGAAAAATGTVVVGAGLFWGLDAIFNPTAAGDPNECAQIGSCGYNTPSGWWSYSTDDLPHGHYQGTGGGGGGGGGTKLHTGHIRLRPPRPRIYIAGPPPPGGAGTFKPFVIDPLENVLDLAAAPAPAPAQVTGTVATDTNGKPCGAGGTVASCAPKESALTQGCDLDGAGTMRSCEPVTPQTNAKHGGGNGGGGGNPPPTTTAQGGCEDLPGIVDPDCAAEGKTIYRAMRPADGGGPEVGDSAKHLGVRPGYDIPIDENGMVRPGTEGMSVNESPTGAPEYRRPPSFGGRAKGIDMFCMNTCDLGPGLRYVPESAEPGHGFIEPAWEMPYTEYQGYLAQTQQFWTEVLG
jgi:RHS repeat-associated protein